MNRPLHIVSFDVPFPPNYGGVIDVFYKVKALSELGIDIYLHVFEYGRDKQEHELNKYCKQVFYYKRNHFIASTFSFIPFGAKSRNNKELCTNLVNTNAPIIFEGLHTTFPLLNNMFNDRKILIRTHNIEHNYFNGLAKSEQNILKKVFFKLEAIKFYYYESILKKASTILSISHSDQKYFYHKFDKKSIYIPVFHKDKVVKKLSEKGRNALYYGNLRVADNCKAVHFLIEVFKEIKKPIIFASSFENEAISKKIAPHATMQFVILKDKNHLNQLVEEAHINVLPTFQKTGIKLKLINALFNGRFCLVNNKMIEDTGLKNLCEIANTKNEFVKKIIELLSSNFSDIEFKKRNNSKSLQEFNTIKNAQKIIDLLY